MTLPDFAGFDFDDAFDEARALHEQVTRDDLANSPDPDQPCDDTEDGQHVFKPFDQDYDRCRECGAYRVVE